MEKAVIKEIDEHAKSKKTRSGKIGKNQKVKLVELMKANKKVAMGTFSGPNSANLSRSVWEAVALELNAVGGAFKTAEQWKKSWSDWKCAVKKQEAKNKKFRNRTGNLPASEGPIPLEGVDVEVLEFLPSDSIDGDGRTREAGFTEKNEIKEEGIEFLDLTKETPKVTSRATPNPNATVLDPATSQSTPRGHNTFGSAYAEIKKFMEDQDERQRQFNNGQQKLTNEILNTLKDMHETLKSIDMALKPQSLND
ncbi:uncharacterized protein [Eurosta solidaginis]|uniref:uncharacterized protein n=1 Tax=Eurosta solidaginis TaxID=178769 RepID=UPI003530F5F1